MEGIIRRFSLQQIHRFLAAIGESIKLASPVCQRLIFQGLFRSLDRWRRTIQDQPPALQSMGALFGQQENTIGPK